MTTVGIFINMIHELPLNAKLNFIINDITYYPYNISLIPNSHIQIGLQARLTEDKYLNNITDIITQNNLDNNIRIHIMYNGYRFVIDFIDIIQLTDNGIIIFYLFRYY